jgi:hypothetical protein
MKGYYIHRYMPILLTHKNSLFAYVELSLEKYIKTKTMYAKIKDENIRSRTNKWLRNISKYIYNESTIDKTV